MTQPAVMYLEPFKAMDGKEKFKVILNGMWVDTVSDREAGHARMLGLCLIGVKVIAERN